MTDTELAALAALVAHETMWMDAFNEHRVQCGYSPGYTEPSINATKLESELQRRWVASRPEAEGGAA